MRERYRMYQRNGGAFYVKDRKTGHATSLGTSDRAEAKRLLVAKNQATEQPYLNISMAKVYLSAQSPEFLTRTWGTVLDHLAQSYEGATAVRWRKFAVSAPLKILVNGDPLVPRQSSGRAAGDGKSGQTDSRRGRSNLVNSGNQAESHRNAGAARVPTQAAAASPYPESQWETSTAGHPHDERSCHAGTPPASCSVPKRGGVDW